MDIYSIIGIFPVIAIIAAVFAGVGFFRARSAHKRLRTLEQKVNYLNSKIEDAVKLQETERKQEDLSSDPEAPINLPVPVDTISSSIVLGQEATSPKKSELPSLIPAPEEETSGFLQGMESRAVEPAATKPQKTVPVTAMETRKPSEEAHDAEISSRSLLTSEVLTEPLAQGAHDQVELKPSRSKDAPPILDRVFQTMFQIIMAQLGFGAGKEEDWESRIGMRWLNLAGIAVLVVGLVLLIQQTILYLGPKEKIALGLSVGAILVGIGLLLQRSKTYRLLARTLIGGGWAVFYFTAYASYNIELAKVIHNPVLALLALITVAVAIIGHSFLYRSQLLTALAYALGLAAIALSPITIFSLVATAILAASLIVVLRFVPWHHLALMGVLGTYFNHWRWTAQVSTLDDLGETASETLAGMTAENGFWLSIAILVIYWILFVIVSLTRQVGGLRERQIHTAIALVNSIGFLGLCGWQIWDHQGGNLHYLTGPATIAYALVSWLDLRFGRKLLYRINGTIAVTLFAVSLPLVYEVVDLSRDWLAPYWTIGAALVWVIGSYHRDLLFRFEAYALSVLSLVAIFQFNLDGRLVDHDPALWFAVPLAILIFELIAERIRSPLNPEVFDPSEKAVYILLSIASAVLIAGFVWVIFPTHEIGLLWLLAGLVLFEIGVLSGRLLLRTQGYILAAAAFFAFCLLNIAPHIGPYLGPFSDSMRPHWIYVAAGVAGLYLLGERTLLGRWSHEQSETLFSVVPSAGATVLFIFITALELDATLLTAVWALWGLVLFETGRSTERWQVSAQGVVLVAVSFASSIIVNIYGLDGSIVALDYIRWAPVCTTTVALGYLRWRTRVDTTVFPFLDTPLRTISSHGVVLLLTLLVWREFPSITVALAWAALGLALFEFSVFTGDRTFRLQSHLLLLAAFARLFMANFITPGEALGISHRVITVVPIIVTLYYLRARIQEVLPIAASTPSKFHSLRERDFGASLYSWLAAILLVVLIRFEVGRGYAVAAWAPIFVAFLVIGIKSDNRDFRFQSYLIAILLFARSWSTNAYLEGALFGLPERIVTAAPAIFALLFAVFQISRKARRRSATATSRTVRLLEAFEAHARSTFALLFSLLVGILIFYQLSIDLVSIGWAIEALALFALGFIVKERSFRLVGLALLLVCLFKVTLLDLQGVETIYRIFSFIVLGVILLLVSLGYSRYRHVMERYF